MAPSNEVLLNKIENIEKRQEEAHASMLQEIRDGFKGVHARQDVTNGKVIKNKEWIDSTKGSIGAFKWVLSFISLTSIIAIIKSFL